MEVEEGLGWVASVQWQHHKGFIHGRSDRHVEMPKAMEQTAGRVCVHEQEFTLTRGSN